MKDHKLPKKMWEKNKSKFLIPRLIQEGIIPNKESFNGFPWWLQAGHESHISKLYKKLGF